MNTEKNALRNKLDDFEYGYREGAWERFEKILDGKELPPVPPPIPDPPARTSFWKRKFGVLLGVAGASAVLFAGWLAFSPTDGTAHKENTEPSGTTVENGYVTPDQIHGLAKMAETEQAIEEEISVATTITETKSRDRQSLAETKNEIRNTGNPGPAMGKRTFQSSQKPGKARLENKSGQAKDALYGLSADKKSKGIDPALEMEPSAQSGSTTPEDAPTPGGKIPLASGANAETKPAIFADFDFLPAPLISVNVPKDSLPQNEPLITPFAEKTAPWKKHETGAYIDVLGPFHGNYLMGGEYTRNWNNYTQSGLGIALHYVTVTESFGDTRYGAFATHFMATQYATMLDRPQFTLRLGVGYRVSLLRHVRYGTPSYEPQPFRASDKRGLLFTAEVKRRWRDDTWLALRFTAVHWLPHLNVCMSKQF